MGKPITPTRATSAARTVRPVLKLPLPPDVAARLAAHCDAWGDTAGAVVLDALSLHLDELDQTARRVVQVVDDLTLGGGE